MRVLHILNELSPSGAETMLETAEPFWAKCEIESHILSTGDEVGIYAKQLSAFKITHIPFKKSIGFFKAYNSYLKNIKPDVIHIHCERAHFLYGVIGRLMGFKVIRTVHHIFYFDGLLKLRKKIERKIMRALGIAFVSNSYSGWLNEKKRYGLNNQFISNWIKVKKPEGPTENVKVKLGLPANTKLFLSVGGNWEYKNFDKVIKAISITTIKEIHYVHIGMDPENKLSNLVKELNVGDRVSVLGFTKNVESYFHGCDVFLMPSELEGFGIAAVEALSIGKMTILSKRPALHDFYFLGDSICYTDTSVEAIAESFTHVLQKLEDATSATTEYNYELVNNLFNPENGAFLYMNLYKRMLWNKAK